MKVSILVIIGLCALVFIYFTKSQKSPVTELPKNEISQREIDDHKRHDETLPDSLDSNPVFPFESNDSNIDSDRDYLLWRKESNEIEAAWNKEIYSHLQYLDRERAEELYEAYLYERRNYLAPQEKSLSDSLDDLSKLNGESIVNEDDFIEPEEHQDKFITTLRSIFRGHYDYIEAQRKIFLDTHTN